MQFSRQRQTTHLLAEDPAVLKTQDAELGAGEEKAVGVKVGGVARGDGLGDRRHLGGLDLRGANVG